MITTTIFRNRFPEFDCGEEYSEGRIQLFIDDTVTLYIGSNESRWNGRYDIAQSYLVAHLLSVATNQESGDSSNNIGTVISKTAGNVSVNRQINQREQSVMDEFLSSTSYGQMFMNIRNQTFVGVITAT